MGVECNFDWGKFGARGVILLPQIICSSSGPVESERLLKKLVTSVVPGVSLLICEPGSTLEFMLDLTEVRLLPGLGRFLMAICARIPQEHAASEL